MQENINLIKKKLMLDFEISGWDKILNPFLESGAFACAKEEDLRDIVNFNASCILNLADAAYAGVQIPPPNTISYVKATSLGYGGILVSVDTDNTGQVFFIINITDAPANNQVLFSLNLIW